MNNLTRKAAQQGSLIGLDYLLDGNVDLCLIVDRMGDTLYRHWSEVRTCLGQKLAWRMRHRKRAVRGFAQGRIPFQGITFGTLTAVFRTENAEL